MTITTRRLRAVLGALLIALLVYSSVVNPTWMSGFLLGMWCAIVALDWAHGR